MLNNNQGITFKITFFFPCLFEVKRVFLTNYKEIQVFFTWKQKTYQYLFNLFAEQKLFFYQLLFPVPDVFTEKLKT